MQLPLPPSLSLSTSLWFLTYRIRGLCKGVTGVTLRTEPPEQVLKTCGRVGSLGFELPGARAKGPKYLYSRYQKTASTLGITIMIWGSIPHLTVPRTLWEGLGSVRARGL